MSRRGTKEKETWKFCTGQAYQEMGFVIGQSGGRQTFLVGGLLWSGSVAPLPLGGNFLQWQTLRSPAWIAAGKLDPAREGPEGSLWCLQPRSQRAGLLYFNFYHFPQGGSEAAIWHGGGGLEDHLHFTQTVFPVCSIAPHPQMRIPRFCAFCSTELTSIPPFCFPSSKNLLVSLLIAFNVILLLPII